MMVTKATCLLLGLSSLDLAFATGARKPHSAEHLLSMIQSSRPGHVEEDFDCAWRAFALQYANKVQPWLSDQHVQQMFDALELSTLCGQTLADIPLSEPVEKMGLKVSATNTTVYVATDGDDSNSGSQQSPLATLQAAVEATRAINGSDPTILLREGTYYIDDTVLLGPEDSHLTISAYNDEKAVLSGGRHLTGVDWKATDNNNIFQADMSGYSDQLSYGITAMHHQGQRATVARYPNANPERDLFPVGYYVHRTTWLPPMYHGVRCDPYKPCGESNTTTTVVDDAWHGMYQNYTIGEGGACERYDPPISPWCSDEFYLLREFPEMHTRSPSGMTRNASQLPNSPYAHPEGALFHAWRPGHWYTWMFEVDSQIGEDFIFSTERGGNQGGEGHEYAGEWFIENVVEELDAENEFFYDKDAQMLYFYLNQTQTGTTVPDSEVVVPTLDVLIDIQGVTSAGGLSVEEVVSSITIQGLTITANRPTFMEPRTNPSGGDWALERQGAIRLEGTQYVTISQNIFERLDTNAISINGYNRGTLIDHNEFVNLGLSAITSWGRTDGNDGTSGAQPRGVIVTNNFVHEIGHIQKQSSFYFQAVSAQAVIEHNIVFNIPRAGINFNDGFGGGADINDNLMFNTCRESGDHGAFNSWDRLPYITKVGDGFTPSTVPLQNKVHNNFIVANYAADGGCLDNDDGSSYYDIHHNFCVYGGHKSNFDGHSKHGYSNVYVYPQVYGVKCLDEEAQGERTGTSGPDGLPLKGYAEKYTDNICILPGAGNLYMSAGGSLDDPKAFNEGIVLSNNTVYVPNGNLQVEVDGTYLSFSKFQSLGFDLTSAVSGDMPSNEQIMVWAAGLLGM